MKRITLQRLVPTALMAVAAAIPIATTVEILAHVPTEQAATPATTAAPAPATSPTSAATAAPATSTPAASATSTTTAAPATTAPAPATPTTATTAATATQPAATATATTRTYVGPVEYNRYGAVQATITVAGGKVTAVTITAPEDNPRSAAINEQAIPILQSETLQAQSATIDLVSGATYTSDSYEQSLQAALDQAHIA